MEWIEVYGTQDERPLELDKVSSKVLVYLRKDIERVTRVDETTGEENEFWHYYEIAMSRTDYAIMLAEQNQANLTYIAMMEDIDLDV